MEIIKHFNTNDVQKKKKKINSILNYRNSLIFFDNIKTQLYI